MPGLVGSNEAVAFRIGPIGQRAIHVDVPLAVLKGLKGKVGPDIIIAGGVSCNSLEIIKWSSNLLGF